MNTHELPNGNLLVPKHPGAPGSLGSGDEAEEIGPDHPEWDRWYEIATNEAVHDSYRRVRTVEEVETALRGMERYERWHAGDLSPEASPDPRTGRRAAADAAIARAMLETVRKSIELGNPGQGT
jgi:hypothetical protein